MRRASFPIVLCLVFLGATPACRSASTEAEAALPEPAKDQCKVTLKVTGMM